MGIEEIAQGNYILWGANWSLYTAKVRPYLIKKGLDYVELNPSHPHFHDSIVPRIGHITVPVVEATDGSFVADSTEIIEHFEQLYPENPMIPADKVLAALAWLIHNFGSEGLLKPAMHYRWRTIEENRSFIVDEFSRSLQVKEARDHAEKAAGLIYAEHIWDYLPMLGLSDQATPIIEQSAARLYRILNAHFLEYPYVLGGSPSIADFGLMAPIYAHLGRDPSSNSQLKLVAPALYRWIETMGRAQLTDPELWYVPPGFFKADELPPTLSALLELIGIDYGPELLATAQAYHQWLPGKPAGAIVADDGQKANHQVLAHIEHEQGGGSIERVAFIDPLALHQRVIAVMQQMDPAQLDQYGSILHAAGCDALFTLQLERGVVRDDYTYVLA